MIILHRQIIYEKAMQNSGKRWFIAVMATLVHLCLGTVYAWSFFQKTVSETFGWSNSETAWAFSLAIFIDRKSTRLNSSHSRASRMPSSA